MKALLMGGQAMILYGGAEFSRDIDFAVVVDPANLGRLRSALTDLKAASVFFPDLSSEALLRGHACRFRCEKPGLSNLRVDVMAVMRGADPVKRLWSRRHTIRVPGIGAIAVMSLPDLVAIKKTQRDKDWPMIRLAVEADVARPGRATPARVLFWLKESRSPEQLMALVRRYPRAATSAARGRRAIARALRGDLVGIAREMETEEHRERAADRAYWAPLRAELEQMRLQRGGR